MSGAKFWGHASRKNSHPCRFVGKYDAFPDKAKRRGFLCLSHQIESGVGKENMLICPHVVCR